jgi:uncharacterized protein with von Willebrand factor type A (vWA) domain
MKVRIISIEDKRSVFYTIEDETPKNIYVMEINGKMIKAANEDFASAHYSDAKIDKEVAVTVERFHKLVGKEVAVVDIFMFARDPDLAPFVSEVYTTRTNKPLGPDEVYRFTPAFSAN